MLMHVFTVSSTLNKVANEINNPQTILDVKESLWSKSQKEKIIAQLSGTILMLCTASYSEQPSAYF